MNDLLRIIAITLLINSCESRAVKFSGLNDLVAGVQQVVLYENATFFLELGAGGKEGKYQIFNDTIELKYTADPEGFPTRLLMTNDHFITLPQGAHSESIKIKRWSRGG